MLTVISCFIADCSSQPSDKLTGGLHTFIEVPTIFLICYETSTETLFHSITTRTFLAQHLFTQFCMVWSDNKILKSVDLYRCTSCLGLPHSCSLFDSKQREEHSAYLTLCLHACLYIYTFFNLCVFIYFMIMCVFIYFMIKTRSKMILKRIKYLPNEDKIYKLLKFNKDEI